VPKRNITETTNDLGGRTTSYLVPTKDLPLTQPLRQVGVPRSIVDEVDKHLRPVVDAGYKRNDPKPKSADDDEHDDGTTKKTGADDATSADADNDSGDDSGDDDSNGTATG
jgi:hypothetical protein